MQNQEIDTLISLLALATRLEDEGRYNLAKLARASVESYLRREAYQRHPPTDKSFLIQEMERLGPPLQQLGTDAAVRDEILRGAAALRAGKPNLYQETPNPFLCRTCGYLVADVPRTNCPVCGARPDTFYEFMPNYWFDDLDPFSNLAMMRKSPNLIAALIEGLSEEQMERQPADGSWSIRSAVTHFRDAQSVLAFRVNLILTQENPPLEFQAVFEWADQEQGDHETTRGIFDTYLVSRRETISRLEQIPLQDWWRTGQHQEFGELTLTQQVSYFVAHELTHLPQIDALLAQK